MLTKPKIEVVDGRKYMVLDPSRLYCGYNTNANQTALPQDTWVNFSYPSGGITEWRNKDFAVHPSLVRFTYTGTEPKWFNITATCNIKKTTKGGASRDIEFQWRHNGVGVGAIRETHMSNSDAEIISGEGQILLNNGDYIEPFVRNIENSDPCVIYNCSYNIIEDVTLALNN